MRVLTVHITTEIIFALFDLLGFRFAPRLRDLHDRRLFVSGAIDMQRYPRLQPHLPGRINRPRILDWWDEMVRAAGSIKLGGVTASLLVQKLQAYPQQNALARALQEYGRLARTLHILRWYAYPEELWSAEIMVTLPCGGQLCSVSTAAFPLGNISRLIHSDV
jgi:TnpA family transposase